MYVSSQDETYRHGQKGATEKIEKGRGNNHYKKFELLNVLIPHVITGSYIKLVVICDVKLTQQQ